MDFREGLHNYIDGELVIVGGVAIAGLLASVTVTAFRPPVALGIPYVATASAIGIQWYRGETFDVRHASMIAVASFLVAVLSLVSGGLSTEQATVVTLAAIMLTLGSANQRYRLLLWIPLSISIPIITIVEYRIQYAQRPVLGSRMVPSLTELLVFWILVAGFAIALGFPLYALGRWSGANVSAAR